ncbi:hypothetical protein KFZ58_02010 [Virgibacillus sp. NKC19-16]|uniref:hypothetical protein n=1 Tax=Virgibacillus salidurans TaxID=2831673 RepID=UPI001F3189A5|nr:hypothetical protein [Virgibacillus sp. NKC19-16]UJL46753.1 hypothetical protein KFZ58_02010 [Virgibacillus sp. NKC19-16]
MNQQSFFTKVAQDMFLAQLKWSLWFLSFILLAHIVMIIMEVSIGIDGGIGDFLYFSHGSSKIYMLVIGILSAYAFLTFYLNHGVTRKDYFTGSALAAAGIAIAIAVIASVLTGLEYVVMEMTNLPVTFDRSMAGNVIETSDNSISIFLPKAILGSSILIHSSSWLVSLLMYTLNILIYYIIGWFIGAGYYRFGWLIGLGFITSALVFMVIADLLWGTELGEPLSNWLPFDSINLPVYGATAGTILLIAIILWLIRLLTKNITIKM